MSSCRNCFYFAQDELSIKDKIGRCYANPPQVMLIPIPPGKMINNPNGGLVMQSVYATVQEDAICRFYKEPGKKVSLDEN